jgi:hypothetical protein
MFQLRCNKHPSHDQGVEITFLMVFLSDGLPDKAAQGSFTEE